MSKQNVNVQLQLNLSHRNANCFLSMANEKRLISKIFLAESLH